MSDEESTLVAYEAATHGCVQLKISFSLRDLRERMARYSHIPAQLGACLLYFRFFLRAPDAPLASRRVVLKTLGAQERSMQTPAESIKKGDNVG